MLFKFLEETGFLTLLKSSRDVHLLIFIKFLRFFGFSAIALINAIYLKEIGYNESQIGLLFTAILVGDLFTTFVISIFADKTIGRRTTLVISSIIMTLTGLYWAWASDKYGYLPLLAVSFFGTITPAGGEVGPFNSIEESAIAQLVEYKDRSDVYTWLSLLASFANALGFMSAGYLISLSGSDWHLDLKDSYRLTYALYGGLCFLMTVASSLLSSRIEAYNHPEETAAEENSPLIPTPETVPVSKGFWSHVLPDLPKETVLIVINLSLLFGLDALAGSLVGKSWISFFFKDKFNISSEKLGNIFFASNLISTITTLFGTSLCKRIGPIKTMVFTHLPSSILLALLPLPENLDMTLTLFILRSFTQTMDNAPKKVFLTSVVKPSERTVVLSWIHLIKTIAGIIGPSITGVLSLHRNQWIAFTTAGLLKVTYDLAIFATFVQHNKRNDY